MTMSKTKIGMQYMDANETLKEKKTKCELHKDAASCF